MHPELAKLIRLQQIDSRIAQLNTELAAIPKRLAQIDAQLASARKRVEDARAALKAGESAKRQHEQEIQSLNGKIAKFRDQSSSVKTNDQYKALLSEIAHAEQQIAGFEEKILETMVAADEQQSKLTAAEAALKAESAEIEQQQKAAQAEGENSRKELEVHQAERNELRAQVDDNLLAQYDRVLRTRGTALSEVRDGRCGTCQVALRPQVLSDIKAGKGPLSCDTCSRLLYYVPEHNVQVVAANTSVLAHQVEREWMYLPDFGDNGAFAVFVNHKTNATMRAYDAKTGEVIARRSEKNTTFQKIFADEMRNARNLFVDEPNIEEKYKEQLPPEILDDLKHQVPDAPASSAAKS